MATSAERAAKAAAKAKKAEKWKQDRAYLRLNDDGFKAREKASEQKYSNFKKAAIQFARARAADFASFLRGEGMASQPMAAQPTPAVDHTAPTPGQPLTPMPRLQTYRALKDFGVEVATAPSLEKARLGDAGLDRLREYGIDMRDLR
jgi:hypothetical protein